MSRWRRMVVRCPACARRNAIDPLASVRRRPTCGACKEPLPRLSGLGWLVVIAVPTVLLVVALALVQAQRERSRDDRAQRAAELARSGEIAEALAILPSGDDGAVTPARLAIADAIAAPVLAVADAESTDLAVVEEAAAAGDRQLSTHGVALPELMERLDEPVRRLQRRRDALRLLEPLREVSADPTRGWDEARAQADRATRQARSASPGVLGLVDGLVEDELDHFALTRAGHLIDENDDLRGAWKLLALREAGASRRVQQRLASETLDTPILPEPAEGSPDELLSALAELDASASPEQLSSLVQVRPGPDWSIEQERALTEVLTRACGLLGDRGVTSAREATTATERADALLLAMTCDQLLPEDFLRACRRQLVLTRLERARTDGAWRAAWQATSSLEGVDRDEALALLACAATEANWPSLALVAWTERSGDGLDDALACAGRDEPDWAWPTTGEHS
ncbi:MAG: hypothetical protein AAF533_04270 [Acidobacteriota bacterium]